MKADPFDLGEVVDEPGNRVLVSIVGVVPGLANAELVEGIDISVSGDPPARVLRRALGQPEVFGRVASFLDQNSPSVPSSLLLAHGEADLVERFKNLVLESIHDPGVDGESTGRADSLRAESWFLSKKRTLLAGHAVGTIDQALLAVMRIRHAFVRLFGLSGKTVILDEVHAYDTYTSTLLERLLEWLGALGTSVVTLSATLPSERRQALIGAYTRGAGADSRVCNHVPYPRITVAGPSGVKAVGFGPRANSASARIIRCAADIDSLAAIVVEQARAGSCVGWVCNTVARSQTAMERVRALMPELEERLLLHSRLLPTERQRRELRLEGWLGKPSRDRVRPKRCVVVGTQVLEQSLDVDFDVLVSDVAPIDLLLQRMGRLWRHERRDRGAVAERCVYVACPTGNWKDARLERVAGVYAESVVRRTLELLENRGVITIPDEIESLVEQVYSGEQPPRDDALSDAWFDEFAERATERVLAAQKLMPRPTVEDDPFGNLQVWLDDEDDPVLNDQLRAVTRLGPRTVDVVCVERKGDRLSLGDGDDETLDLGVEPDRTLAARLVRRSIGLSHSRVVSALLDEDPPEGWKRSPLLRYRRLVAFERGEATIGGVRLLLDDELGLRIGNERSS